MKLLDKNAFCGGNSTKATSGINGAGTKAQADKGIEDSVKLFTSDTLKGGARKPEVVEVLCGNSGPDVDCSLCLGGVCCEVCSNVLLVGAVSGEPSEGSAERAQTLMTACS